MKLKEKIIVASHGFSGSPFKVGSLHLSKYFSRSGYAVLLITVPVSLFHLANVLLGKSSSKEVKKKFKCILKGIYKTQQQFYEWVPFTLLPLMASNSKLFAFVIKQIGKCIPFLKTTLKNWRNVKFLIIENPRFFWLTEVVEYEVLIYRITDIYSEMESVGESFIETEKRLIVLADYVFATSSFIKLRLEDIYCIEKEIKVIENGVELENFLNDKNKNTILPYTEMIKKEKINLVFVGAMDDRFDFEILVALSQLAPEVEIFLFGPVAESDQKLYKRDNLHFLGVVDYQVLGDLLKEFDIGLLPFKDSLANDGRSPMKLFEYGICGLPVVARKTQDLLVKSQNYDFIFLYEDVSGFRDAIYTAYNIKSELSSKAIASAKANSWELITERMLEIID